MNRDEMEHGCRHLDRRVDRVELILPTLATRDDLQAAIGPLATKAELRETKTELHDAIGESGSRMRAYFDVGFERLRDDIRLIAEGLAVLSQMVDQNHSEIKTDIAGVDSRPMRLEADRSDS